MQARMKNPVFVIPEAMQALMALNKATEKSGLSEVTTKLVHLRASQINGCSVCVDMHAQELKKAGETDRRERAALALTEAVTRIADRSDAVPDDVWNEAAKYYDEKAISGLLLQIAQINVWNRLNASVRQVAGAAWN